MYERMFAMGVTMYGQMTAGSYCYIGPQGIVHGTTVRCMLLNFQNFHGYMTNTDIHSVLCICHVGITDS